MQSLDCSIEKVEGRLSRMKIQKLVQDAVRSSSLVNFRVSSAPSYVMTNSHVYTFYLSFGILSTYSACMKSSTILTSNYNLRAMTTFCCKLSYFRIPEWFEPKIAPIS